MICPTFVVPPRTGTEAADEPDNCIPLIVTNVAKHTMLPRTVGTPGMEKLPLAAVVPVMPMQFTAAPATSVPTGSTTVPVTVVRGSGIAMMVMFGELAVAPAVSRTEAPMVNDDTPVGTVKLNMYGEDTVVN